MIRRRLRILRAAVAFAVAGVLACGSSSTGPATPANDAGAGAAADAGVDTTSDGGAPEPAASPCAATRAFVERCGGELTCGAAAFDAWCAASDRATNSDAYRRAEAKCLPDVACDARARRDCEYRHYATETPTPAQRALVDAYCRTCEPSDVQGCASRATAYDPANGPDGVEDIFVAAWELRDALCDGVREKCTGGALDAGGDCRKSFASCAADVYLDAVPDCP